MRITPTTLYNIAREAVNRRTRVSRDVLAVYLCGSLLESEPLLGGTVDIDLVFIHYAEVEQEREIEKLTDEVHLDVVHHTDREYRQGRELRSDPWLGPTIFQCKALYDPQHFMDFTQASVRGQYHRPDYVLARAQTLAGAARRIWMAFYQDTPKTSPQVVGTYLQAVESAANAIASLSGPPLSERRLLLRFQERAQAVGRPGLHAGLLGLLGGNALDGDGLRAYLPAWERAYEVVGMLPDGPAALHPVRRAYYLRAFRAMLDSDQPLAALWPVLHSWTLAACSLRDASPSLIEWTESIARLGIGGSDFRERVAGLDVFLDTVEETLEDWARESGA